MPTYVYKFVETGETIEVQQAFTDDPLTEAAHPGTGKLMAVKKVFTPVGVTFKGSGFYKTDSRSSSTSSPSSSSASTSSADTAGSSPSSSAGGDSGSSGSSSSTDAGSASPSGSSAKSPD